MYTPAFAKANVGVFNFLLIKKRFMADINRKKNRGTIVLLCTAKGTINTKFSS